MSEKGGLSGKPLNKRSTEVIRLIADHTDGNGQLLALVESLIQTTLGKKSPTVLVLSKFIHRWFSMVQVL